MSVNIQQTDKTLKKVADTTVVNKTTVTNALGYTPVTPTELNTVKTNLTSKDNNLQQQINALEGSAFDGDYNKLKNAPILNNADGAATFADETGNIIARINNNGLETTNLNLHGDIELADEKLEIIDEAGNIVLCIDDNGVETKTTNELKTQVTNINTVLPTKAPIDNPAFTGAPKAPSPIDNSNQRIATTDYVDNAVTGLQENISDVFDFNDDGTLTLADAEGRKIAEFDSVGLRVTNVTIGEEDAPIDIAVKLSNIDTSLDSKLDKETVEHIDFSGNNFILTDENGIKIAQIDENGLTIPKIRVFNAGAEEPTDYDVSQRFTDIESDKANKKDVYTKSEVDGIINNVNTNWAAGDAKKINAATTATADHLVTFVDTHNIKDSGKKIVDSINEDVKSNIPTGNAVKNYVENKISDYDTNTVQKTYVTKQNLENTITGLQEQYYTKDETKDYVAEQIALADHLKREVVETLPTSDINTNIIYMVKAASDEQSDQDLYDEYMYINGAWERLGSWQTDLNGYVKNDILDGYKKEVLANFETSNKKIDEHIADKNNPHKVTAEQVGLGKVTNESKTTMFTNPNFTGGASIDGEKISTEEYVDNAISQIKIPELNYPVTSVNGKTGAVTLIANDVGAYTKGETDGLLNNKANADNVYTKNDVYTKTETNNLLSPKADADKVYTKTETDNLLKNKANAADVYTKGETNNLLNNKAPLASPSLTGTPTAPTAAKGTNTTQIATTAFVADAIKTMSNEANSKFDALDFYKTVKVGSTSIAAEGNDNTLTLVAGSNVTLTPDVTKKEITISSVDTDTGATSVEVTGTGNAITSAEYNSANRKITFTTDTFETKTDADTKAENLQNSINNKLAKNATIKLDGNATGTASFENDEITIQVTVADNSHKHTTENITDLKDKLDAKTNDEDFEKFKTTNTAALELKAEKTDLNNYYNKEEVDDYLNNKMNAVVPEAENIENHIVAFKDSYNVKDTGKTITTTIANSENIPTDKAVKTYVDNIASGKVDKNDDDYKNQNAFSNIKIGNTTIAADTVTDTVTFTTENDTSGLTIAATANTDTISFSIATDATPTSGSTKAIQSGGVYTAINSVNTKLDNKIDLKTDGVKGNIPVFSSGKELSDSSKKFATTFKAQGSNLDEDIPTSKAVDTYVEGRIGVYNTSIQGKLDTKVEKSDFSTYQNTVQEALNTKISNQYTTADKNKVLVVDENGKLVLGTPTIEGAVEAAGKLSTARKITLEGDITGFTDFDGSKDVTIPTQLSDDITEQFDNIKTSYLPLAGGTMSGPIVYGEYNAEHNVIFSDGLVITGNEIKMRDNYSGTTTELNAETGITIDNNEYKLHLMQAGNMGTPALAFTSPEIENQEYFEYSEVNVYGAEFHQYDDHSIKQSLINSDEISIYNEDSNNNHQNQIKLNPCCDMESKTVPGIEFSSTDGSGAILFEASDEGSLFSFEGAQLKNISSPEDDNDAVPKSYVDNLDTKVDNLSIFKTVKIDKKEITADNNADTLTFAAGTNITITPNDTDKIITISSVDTDTGATSVEVTGTGNAITSAEYNSANRKITLTKDTTFTTPDDITPLSDTITTHINTGDIHVTTTDKDKWNAKSDFSGSYNDLTNKPTLFSGDYNDLTNKPTIPVVPNNFKTIKVGEKNINADDTKDILTLAAGTNITLSADVDNDTITINAIIPPPDEVDLTGYVTTEALENTLEDINENFTNIDTALENVYTKGETNNQIDEKIAALVNSAPNELNTLGELAAALGNDEDFATTVLTEIGKKANSEDINTQINALDFYKTVKVGSTSIAAEGNDNTLTLVAGSNVTLTPDVTKKEITISSVDTDTGATSIVTSGEGNAVTGASYDAGNRKITLIKGTTFATKEEIPELNYPVTSVNGKTGAVTLIANDVGAYTKGETDNSLSSKANTADVYTKKETDDQIDAKIATLVDSAPDELNTLNELAAALGNDKNFATTVLTEIGKKANSTDVDTKINALDFYKTIQVGSTSIAAEGNDNTLTLVAGSNVTLTPDATNKKVTIASNYVDTDTGATSIVTSGEGNAVTGASYDAENRKITLTKGTTFTTKQEHNNHVTAYNTFKEDFDSKFNLSLSEGSLEIIDDQAEQNILARFNNEGLTTTNINVNNINAKENITLKSEAEIHFLDRTSGYYTGIYVSGNQIEPYYSDGESNEPVHLINLATPEDDSAATNKEYVDTVVDTKMDKVNPVGTGSFSLNRKAGTEVGARSFAEGQDTIASATGSHAEGFHSTASGTYSHAEGFNTNAEGNHSHAEGNNTTSSGVDSHTEGMYSNAKGNYSHAEGYDTIASGDNQHVQGKCNIEDTEYRYAHIVGNGEPNGGAATRSNAHTLDWDGNSWYAGGLYVGGEEQDDANIKILPEENNTFTISDNNENIIAQFDKDGLTATNFIIKQNTADGIITYDLNEIIKNLNNNTSNSNIIISETPPDSPTEGMIWIDTDDEGGDILAAVATSGSFNDLIDKPTYGIADITNLQAELNKLATQAWVQQQIAAIAIYDGSVS